MAFSASIYVHAQRMQSLEYEMCVYWQLEGYRIASGVLFIFNLALCGMAVRIVEQCLKGKKKTQM